MKSLLIRLDDATIRALDRIAPARKRRRSEFVRSAIRQPILRAEYDAMRKAYERNPDAKTEADDWSNAQQFRR